MNGLFNHKCFNNAVQYYYDNNRKGNKVKVFEVIAISESDPCLHYINYDKNTKTYLETTLGYKANSIEYYLIREVHKDEFTNIENSFKNSLNEWNNRFISWIDRVVFGIKRAV